MPAWPINLTMPLIALTGITGCGKTTTARRIRQDLDKERKILVATNLAVDKERVKLGTLMEAIVADIGTDKEATLPTQAELRERRLRDLIQRRSRPVALFIDEAHDLHPKTMVGLKRLVEVVQEGGRGPGHRSRRPATLVAYGQNI